MVEPDSFHDLFVDEARNLYDAEKQLATAVEHIAATASSEEVSAVAETCLEETRTHVQRLEEVFELLGEDPAGQRCFHMADILGDGADPPGGVATRDGADGKALAIVQRAICYAIGAYGSLIASAATVGAEEAVAILRHTLAEDSATDESLRALTERQKIGACLDGPLPISNGVRFTSR
jgi:ferritin-like metal-binding protein YciE